MNSRRLDLVLAAAIFVAATGFFASFEPWKHPVVLDAATWDYMAVETARGMVPYRDVFLHKTPAAALLGAVGASAGSALGVEPVLAAHTLFLLLGALAPALLFAICRASGLPRGAAMASAVALLAYDEWTVSTIEGCLPKVPTVVFGLAAMLAAERGRGVPASLLGGASVLFWQPGLAFLLGAWATLVRNGQRRDSGSRRRRVLRLPQRRVLRLFLLGLVSLVPAALLLAWLAAHGAIHDFFEQAVMFNVDYIHDKARTPQGTLRALVRTFGEWNVVELLLAPAALAGLWLGWSRRSSAGSMLEAGPRFPLSVLVSGCLYATMTFVSYQSWPDAILLGPIIASVLGVGIYFLLSARLAAPVAAGLTVAVLALAAVPGGRPKFHPPVDFATQRTQFRELAGGLGPDDRVIGVSVPEFFLHTSRRNGWKWPYLWFGVDEFAAGHHEGGFEGMLGDLEADPPAMILLARLWAGPQRARFEEWAATRYDVSTVRIFPHTRKPMRVYRLRR